MTSVGGKRQPQQIDPKKLVVPVSHLSLVHLLYRRRAHNRLKQPHFQLFHLCRLLQQILLIQLPRQL